MAKIKKCHQCGKKFKMSKKYAEFISNDTCIKCVNKTELEQQFNEEYMDLCGGRELFL